MTVYATVETCQGVVEEVRAFLSEESAEAAERKWLEFGETRLILGLCRTCEFLRADCGRSPEPIF
jgi:hypothetical protein